MRPRRPVAILVPVPASRRLLTWFALLVALALAVPAVTLASGGGSAGDQQYTDPFAGTPTPQTHTGGTQTATLTATAPAPATTPASAGTTPATGTRPPAATPAPATATSAPAVSAASATTSTRPTTLPFTGYDSWLAAGLGAGMVAGGIVLRRRARRT